MSTNPSNEELDALAQRLRRLPEPPVPGDLEGRLLAAIPGPAPSEARPRRLWWARAGAAAAAVVLAFFLGYLAGKAERVPNPPQPQPQMRTAKEERPPEVPVHGRPSPDLVSLSSFEWPVSATLPVSAHRLPEELTD